MPAASLTFIIPFIDEYEFLREAIQSVLAQELADQEVIVVGNDTTQPDEHLIRSMFDKVKILHEPVPGSAYARNTGLHAATGKWIQFLDVDDILLPGKIKHQLDADDADVAVSPHLFQFLSGRQQKSKWLANDIWIGLLNSGLGSTSSMLWKRDALLEVGGWNPGYSSHQEYELLFRLLQAGKKIKTIAHAETIVRQRQSGSITLQSKPVRGAEGIQLREEMWRYVVNQGMVTPARENAFRQYIFRQLRGLYRQNEKQAMKKYREYFHGKSFIPEEIPVPGYNLIYKVFGFNLTEKIIRVARYFSGRSSWKTPLPEK